jgi:hypothetical protein
MGRDADTKQLTYLGKIGHGALFPSKASFGFWVIMSRHIKGNPPCLEKFLFSKNNEVLQPGFIRAERVEANSWGSHSMQDFRT